MNICLLLLSVVEEGDRRGDSGCGRASAWWACTESGINVRIAGAMLEAESLLLVGYLAGAAKER
jgi:hypothetical protein